MKYSLTKIALIVSYLIITTSLFSCEKNEQAMCETTIEPEDLPEAVHQIYDPELVIYTDSLDINVDGQLNITLSFNELVNDPDPPVGFEGIVKVELYTKSVNHDFEFSFG